MASVDQTATVASSPDRSPLINNPLEKIFKLLTRKSAWIGFLVTGLVIWWGWEGRNERNFRAEEGIGYALGIIGASMMLALLIYPLRKRIRALSAIGSTRNWFRFHMILGVIGPVLILYHCNFSVSSLNSRVALFCTLLVAGSGVVGRYLYSQIHHGLYGEKINLRSLVGEVKKSLEHISASTPATNEVLENLSLISEEVLEPPKDVFQSAIRPFIFAFRTRWTYLQLSLKLRAAPGKPLSPSETNPTSNVHATAGLRREIRQHLKQVRRVAHLSFFERLFSLWHILHLPFFFMLVISAIVHILAVNMY